MGRATIRTKASRPSTSTSAASTGPAGIAGTRSRPATKRSQRIARHAIFVSRIEKSCSTSTKNRDRKATKKKERLLATLDSLADALPSTATAPDAASEGMARRRVQGLKSRPGAMKRKERLLRSECERFGQNLAILEGVHAAAANAAAGGSGNGSGDAAGTGTADTGTAAGSGQGAAPAGSNSNRWAMLRNFIGATIEKKEEFLQMEAQAAKGREVVMTS